jgi:hypothetical protein
MLVKLVILGIGMIIGAMLMMVVVVIMIERSMRPRKKPPTKDEWRMM